MLGLHADVCPGYNFSLFVLNLSTAIQMNNNLYSILSSQMFYIVIQKQGSVQQLRAEEFEF